MAKLKAVIDKLDDVAEQYRDLYTKRESDGKFVLDADGVEDVSGLKAALETERSNQKKLAAKFKDLDPDKYAAALKRIEDIERQEAEAEKNWKALEKQLLDRHAAELKGRDDANGVLRRALERHLVDSVATSAIAGAKGVPELLLPHVKGFTKVVEQDGEFVVQVVDSKGNQRIGDNKGTPMTIAQLVEEMKASPTYGRAFEAPARGSSTTTTTTTGGSGGAVRLSREDAKDPAKYRAARDAAAKAGVQLEIEPMTGAAPAAA